jgi:hypothetical protein
MMNKKKAGAYMGGGMAKKKKPMAATGYKEGGDTKKKETFGQAFKRSRKKFINSGSAADYTFKHNGKSYNILQKGETKAGVMKKFSAPKTSVRPKTRPSAGISANTKKKIEETVRKVATPSATTSKDKGSSYEERQKQLRKDKAAAAKRRGIGAGSFAGKGAGKDKPKAKPTRKADGVPARLREKTTDGLPKGIGGMLNRKDEPGAPFLGSKGGKSAKAKAANSAKVAAGQAKYRDRGTPVQLTLSRRNLRKFKKDPSSLTKIEKDRLFKTLKRQGVAIPKGLSGNNR